MVLAAEHDELRAKRVRHAVQDGPRHPLAHGERVEHGRRDPVRKRGDDWRTRLLVQQRIGVALTVRHPAARVHQMAGRPSTLGRGDAEYGRAR